MIEGLQFDVTYGEMRDHLRERAAHHQQRAKFYGEKVAGLGADVEDIQAAMYANSSVVSDPLKALKDKQAQHRRRGELFAFMERHLIEGETYRLDEHELSRLEFISEGRAY